VDASPGRGWKIFTFNLTAPAFPTHDETSLLQNSCPTTSPARVTSLHPALGGRMPRTNLGCNDVSERCERVKEIDQDIERTVLRPNPQCLVVSDTCARNGVSARPSINR